MKASAYRRIARLEKRQPEDPFARMSEDERTRYCDDKFDEMVQSMGLDEAKAIIREFVTPAHMEHLHYLKAVRAIRDE